MGLLTVLGGIAGSFIPIPGVGTAIGTAFGTALDKAVAPAVDNLLGLNKGGGGGNGGGGSPSNEKKTTQVAGLMPRSNSTATADQIQVAQVFNPNDRNPFDMETNVRSWFTQKG
tara:strand:- start:8 stop:349 length:342 start_codon:yes stop_codon:yes gene_type:complete